MNPGPFGMAQTGVPFGRFRRCATGWVCGGGEKPEPSIPSVLWRAWLEERGERKASLGAFCGGALGRRRISLKIISWPITARLSSWRKVERTGRRTSCPRARQGLWRKHVTPTWPRCGCPGARVVGRGGGLCSEKSRSGPGGKRPEDRENFASQPSQSCGQPRLGGGRDKQLDEQGIW